MKNTFKKLAAAAMAFTLLGTGTALTRKAAPKADNSLTAHAYIPPQYCSHNSGFHKYVISKTDCGSYYAVSYWLCCNSCGSPLYRGCVFEAK